MQVVYHLWSATTPDWLRVIADGMPRDDPRVPSLTSLWPGAEWMEREAYDMFGIIFEGNRDLRRIYMPPDYTSFPLRKDFYLPDDAARSPGGGVRHMEQTHAPRPGDAVVVRPHGEGLTMTAARHAGQHPPRTTRGSCSTTRSAHFEPVPPYPPRTEREAEFYTLGDGEMFLNMGPQHPSTHGVLRVVLKINGERVVDLDPVLGYLHRGVEKLCENADYHQIISQVDPLEYVSSLFCEWSPVMAFEQLLDVEVPRRAEYIRVLIGRAQPDREPRAVHGLDGARPGRPDADPVQLHRARRDLRDAGLGHRPADAVQLLPDRRRQRRHQPRVHVPPRRLDEPRDRAARREHPAAQRERDLRPPDARHRPARQRDGAPDGGDRARTCAPPGVPFDIRRAHPYSVYPELEFDIPTRGHGPEGGDALDRYLLRVEEVKQSLRIIDQCLHNMPDGPVMAKLPRLLRPRPGPRVGRASRARAACTGPTRSRTARTSRSG